MSVIDNVIEGKIKKNDLILTGVYLEPEVAKVLDMLGKKGGRGTKSKIANEALRNLFKEKGLIGIQGNDIEGIDSFHSTIKVGLEEGTLLRKSIKSDD